MKKTTTRCRLAVLLGAALAGLLVHGGSLKLGEWTGDFVAATNQADKSNTPVLIYWGSSGCGYCRKMKTAFDTQIFKDWQKTSNILLVKVENDADVKAFVRNKSAKFPYMCVYWPKKDGLTLKDLFTGREGSGDLFLNGTYQNNDLYKRLAGLLIERVEKDIVGYTPEPPQPPVGFALAGTEKSHLEILAGQTAFLDVPLKREDSANSATNVLVATYAAYTNDAAQVSNETTQVAQSVNVAWSSNETSRLVRIDFKPVPQGPVTLKLYAADGTNELAASAAQVRTNTAVSISYPLFVGEKTKDELAWGEWTMDLETAKAKVAAAAGSAYTLVNVGADLWCPWCQKIAEGLYKKDAFVGWARSNQVALVSIDEPRSDGGSKASLLSYEEDKNGASGAFYLSSKSIERKDAEAVLERNHGLAYEDYFLPGTGRDRVGYPTFVLLDKDGKIVGRYNLRYETEAVAENLARLTELLKATDAGAGDETHKDSSTTKLALSEGAELVLTNSVNDTVAFVKVPNLKVGLNTYTATSRVPVSVELFTTTNGSWTGRQILASGQNALTYDTAKAQSNAYLRISVYADARSADYAVNGDTRAEIRVSTQYTAKPGELAFTGANLKWMETQGEGTVTVVRKDGVTGPAKVTVAVDTNATTAAAGRYELPADTTLEWAEGESGEKSIAIKLVSDRVYQGSQKLVLRLVNSEGATVSKENGTKEIEIFDTDDPIFGESKYVLTFYKGFEKEIVLDTYNTDEAKLTIKRLSGRLPSGVSLKYDRKTNRVVLHAKASRTGEGVASYALSVRRKVNGRYETKQGQASVFEIKVVDPKTALDEDGQPLNPYLGTTVQKFTIPATDGLVLDGVLEISISSRNAISAKFVRLNGKTLTFRGAWSDLDYGTATAEIRTRKGDVLSLTLDRDGTIYGTVSYDNGNTGVDLMEVPLPNADALGGYAGYYTVTFPVSSESEGESDVLGTGYLTLKAEGSSFNRYGKVTYSGLAPDGRALRGSATLIPDAETESATGARYGFLPILNSTTKGGFSALLRIRADGKDPIDANEDPAVIDPGQWLYPVVTTSNRAVYLDCYGGVYDSKFDFYGILSERGATPDEGGNFAFTLASNADKLGASEKYGTIESLPAVSVYLDEMNDFKVINLDSSLKARVKIDKRNGLFSGTIPIVFEGSSRKVTGTLKGALLPGWLACKSCGELPYELVERPFASGLVYFTDRVGGKSVRRTFSVDVEVFGQDEPEP